MIEKVGLNLTALGTIEAPNITVPETGAAFLTYLPENAATISGGYFPYFSMIVIFVVTYWLLADKTPLGDFRYSDLRAMCLAFGITSSIGITQVMIGFFESWMAVVFFLLSFVLTNVILVIVENKQ